MKLAAKTVLLATLLVGSSIASALPATAAASCNGSGWLCFKEVDLIPPISNNFGNVSGTNANWSALSSPWGNWDNRADWFRNDGTTHNACVHIGYNHNTTPRALILKGVTWDEAGVNGAGFKNAVSSNKWTTSSTTCA
jgi:hypothetical protein